jgi:ArsR family transcriptional regulator
VRGLLAITNALADESRVRILASLEGGELCACQIIALLELAPSTVSKHLALLRSAGLVEGRKDGRWMHYRLADRGAGPLVRRALAWVRSSLEGEPRIVEDRQRLRAILAIDPEKLCCMQRDGKPCCPPTRRGSSASRAAAGAGRD